MAKLSEKNVDKAIAACFGMPDNVFLNNEQNKNTLSVAYNYSQHGA